MKKTEAPADGVMEESSASPTKFRKIKEGKYLPVIPFRLLEHGQRVPVDIFDAALEKALSMKFRRTVEKYRYKKGSGIPGENDIEIWVIAGNLYYLKEWDEYIQRSLEFHEYATFF